MKNHTIFSILLSITLLVTIFTPVHADGIIIPDPCTPQECPDPLPLSQLSIRYHHVTVDIQNQVAVTHVDQVFYNPNSWTIEGTYIFPLPLDAAVTNFTLWVDGSPVQGQVLDADQARMTYEQAIQSMQDPALLEYIGRGALQARVYPIQPYGERRIEIEYTQILTAENGLVHYEYPLNTERFSLTPLESVSIRTSIHSDQPIRAVYSPSHPLTTVESDEYNLNATYEEFGVTPNTDFSLFYSVGETEAFHLMTYHDPADTMEPDGFFLLMLAPGIQSETQAIGKDVILVIDHSGSMDGEKFFQAQTAARYILENLNPQDRFGVIAFSTNVESYQYQLASAEQASDAINWVNQIYAGGTTDINRALLEAASLANPERPTYIIFLTDGLPTEGVVESNQILANFASTASQNIRLFAFGVGYDVDTFLLDSLTQEHNGLSTYISPGDALDESLSSFYSRISNPVLTNIQLDFGGLDTYDIYPNPIPDLFAGTQIILTGRYRGGGSFDVSMSGVANGQTQVLHFNNQLFQIDNAAGAGSLTNLPRLWATRKIGYLLNRIRLQGADQETIDQIVRISLRYGIITPYTSYLVTEPLVLGAEGMSSVAADSFTTMQAMPTAPSSGQQAFESAAGQGAMSRADVPVEAVAGSAGQMRTAGARSFILQNGVWMDTTYDPATMQPILVQFLSDAYFELAERDAGIGAGLGLGQQVLIVINGTAYQVVLEGGESETLPDSASSTTDEESSDKGAFSLPCLGGLFPIGMVGATMLIRCKRSSL